MCFLECYEGFRLTFVVARTVSETNICCVKGRFYQIVSVSRYFRSSDRTSLLDFSSVKASMAREAREV